MEKFLARRRKVLKEATEEKLTMKDIDNFFAARDKQVRKRIKLEIKYGDYGDYDMWDAIEDELYEYNPKDFTPETRKYFKKRIWQIIDEYEGTNYAETELDEGCKSAARRRKMLKEDTGLYDKINNYLIKIGEEPLDAGNSNKIEPVHTRKNTTVTESKKAIKKPANLLESLNKGFEQIYGNLDDNKRLTEAKEAKKKYPIKEFFADHMDELNKIMNNKKSSEKQKKQEILDLLNSSDVSKSQIDQFARKMEATHDWGFYGFIGTYITAQKVNECVDNRKKKLNEGKTLINEDLTDEEKKDNETFVKLFRRLRSTQQTPLTKEMEDLLDKYDLHPYYDYKGKIKMQDQSQIQPTSGSHWDTIFSTGSIEGDRKVNWVDKIKKMRERNPHHIYLSGFNFFDPDFTKQYKDDRGFGDNIDDYSAVRNQTEIISKLNTKEGIEFLVTRKNKALKELENPNSKWSKGQCIDYILAYNNAVDQGIIKFGKKVNISELFKD